MRVVVAVIAALVTLGLAAFGVVAAQKAAGPSSIIALAARVISPGQNDARRESEDRKSTRLNSSH